MVFGKNGVIFFWGKKFIKLIWWFFGCLLMLCFWLEIILFCLDVGMFFFCKLIFVFCLGVEGLNLGFWVVVLFFFWRFLEFVFKGFCWEVFDWSNEWVFGFRIVLLRLLFKIVLNEFGFVIDFFLRKEYVCVLGWRFLCFFLRGCNFELVFGEFLLVFFIVDGL